MRQALCEISVVGEKKQAFGLCVEASNIEQLRKFRRQQIKNSIARVRIFPGRNESGGLVQDDGEWRRDVNKFAIYLDVVARAGLHAKIGARFTIDCHPARSDQFVTMPARANTRSGEEAIKAHSGSVIPAVIPSGVEESRGDIRRQSTGCFDSASLPSG